MKQKIKNFEMEIVIKAELNYLLYLPENYNTKKKWPLILFLHGAGECGDDIEIVKRNGIPKIVEYNSDFPFIAVSPQCPEHSYWEYHMIELKGLIDEIKSNYNVDESRVYLTGLSMGGYGALSLGVQYPEEFAAVVPICGGLYDPNEAETLKDIPIWIFHGAEDDIVPIEESQNVVDVLRRCGGNVNFTVYEDAGHDSWSETYDNPRLYEWLLQQSRTAGEQ